MDKQTEVDDKDGVGDERSGMCSSYKLYWFDTFFLLSNNCYEHISYVKLIGTDKPETEMIDMAVDNDNSKYTKMKIVLTRHILILNKAACNMLF